MNGMNVKTLCLPLLALHLASPSSLAQVGESIPFRVQVTMGWNSFVFDGVETDMKAIRNASSYSQLPIPPGHFGRDYDYSLSILTPLNDNISIGIAIQYFRTSGYFQNTSSTSIGMSIIDELEYRFSRVSPKIVAKYSHEIQSARFVSLSLRLEAGPTFGDLRKDLNNSSLGTSPPFGNTGYHLRAEYKPINPEYSASLSVSVAVLNNLRLVVFTGYAISTSKNVEGTCEPFSTNVPFDINLKYQGVHYGGGVEIGL